MKADPWDGAVFGLEIAFDVAILFLALLFGWVAVECIQSPVPVFGAAVFITTSICWLVADIWRAFRLRVLGWIIPSVVPEVGVTFSWSEHSVSVCFYLVRVNVIGTLYRRVK